MRFQWLLEKDYKSFGINFKTYVVLVMIMLFSTMVHAIHKYHVRYRRSLRPIFSASTFVSVFCWALLIMSKVLVYVICFINTPGLIFMPVLIRILISFITFECLEEDFKSKEKHEKFVYLLVTFMVPVSLPSKELKTSKKLYMLNFILYFVECVGLLCFGLFMRNYYHNRPYCTYFEKLAQRLDLSFNTLLFLLFGLVLAASGICSLLLWISSKYFHPKDKLMPKELKKNENDKEAFDDEFEYDLTVTSFGSGSNFSKETSF